MCVSFVFNWLCVWCIFIFFGNNEENKVRLWWKKKRKTIFSWNLYLFIYFSSKLLQNVMSRYLLLFWIQKQIASIKSQINCMYVAGWTYNVCRFVLIYMIKNGIVFGLKCVKECLHIFLCRQFLFIDSTNSSTPMILTKKYHSGFVIPWTASRICF